MRIQTPLTAGEDAVRQLLAFATEIRSKYLLTDSDFEWKQDWDVKADTSDLLVGGTATLQDVDVRHADYIHVGNLVIYYLDFSCTATLAGGCLGFRAFKFQPPVSVKEKASQPVFAVGSGYMKGVQNGLAIGVVGNAPCFVRHRGAGTLNLLNHFQANLGSGTTHFVGADAATGLSITGFYITDILPTRIK